VSVNVKVVAENVFNILRGYGLRVKIYDDSGKVVIDPAQATRFAVADPNMLVRIDDNDQYIRMNTYKAPGQDMPELAEKIRQQIKDISKKYMYNFDFGIFGKKLVPVKSEKIDIDRAQGANGGVMEQKIKEASKKYSASLTDRDYQQIRKASMRGLFAHKFKRVNDEVIFLTDSPNKLASDLEKIIDSGETSWSEILGIQENKDFDMNEKQPALESFGYMTGSSKTSYQPLDNIKIVVKHRKPVNEESRGARSRNIHSIYIQRGEERFKMAENNLRAARAMARHLNMGGEVFDSVGEAITEMAAEHRKLKEFSNYVRSARLINEENSEYVELAKENMAYIKSTLDKLSGVKTYSTAVESVTEYNNIEILEDDLGLEQKFTQTHFDERVSLAGQALGRSVAKRNKYRENIESAIQSESFDDIKTLLSETEDLVDFATPHAKLSYQVSRLGDSAQDNTLKNHLYSISRTLSDGGSLGDFEYRTLKQCLMNAAHSQPQPEVQTQSVEESYAAFLEKFNIF
jgi:hypothetical protein